MKFPKTNPNTKAWYRHSLTTRRRIHFSQASLHGRNLGTSFLGHSLKRVGDFNWIYMVYHIYQEIFKFATGCLQNPSRQETSIWFINWPDFFSAVSWGHVMAQPFTNVAQDPNFPDIGLTQTFPDRFGKFSWWFFIILSDLADMTKRIDTLFEFSAFCIILREFAAFLRIFSYEFFLHSDDSGLVFAKK